MTRPDRQAPDAGFAMLSAVLLMTISSVLMMALIAYSLTEMHQTGQHRQRNSALNLAEGAVDTMIGTITQTTGPASTLPCSASTTDTRAVPDTITVATTVTYYDASGATLACPLAAAATPAQALVHAVATSQQISETSPARRVMEALLALRPPSVGLTKAIFGDRSISITNNTTINGSGNGNDADIYTNGPFACSNNETINGSVHSQSTLSMSQSCDIAGDAWSIAGFTAGNAGNSVGGRVLVSGGNATLANGASVTNRVRASGTITWNQCPAQCSPNAAVSPPSTESFPQLSWNASTQAAWSSAGYTVVTVNSCATAGGTNAAGQWVIDHAATLTGPTLLRTPCALTLTSNSNLALSNNLAVFADGGITLAGNQNISSTSTTSQSFYLVQPYNAVASLPCNVDGVLVQNHVAVDTTVNMLMYSPCIVHKANLSAINGQMYSATTVQIDNQLNMSFDPLPVYGATDSSGNQPPWAADILSERENH